jgi:hypothetical protein
MPTQAPCAFFNEPLNRPPSPIHVDHPTGGHYGEVGHQDFALLRPIVAPPLTQDGGDISKVPQASLFGVGREDPAVARLVQGHPAPSIVRLRQTAH